MDTESSATTTPVTSKPTAAKPAAKKPARKGVKTGKKAKSKKPVAKRPAKKTAPKKKVAAKRPAAKKTAAATRAPRLSGIPNKAEFIRSLPGLPAKEVVRRAAELGAVLTESYVYNTRGLQKGGGKKAKHAKSATYGTATVRKVPPGEVQALHPSGPASIEDLFYAVVAEIGTVKCVHMLMASHDLVKSALAGARG